MPRPARTELSLTEWAVLGVVAERDAHGWDVARHFGRDGELGAIWSVSRPLVYRALGVLEGHGYVVELQAVAGRTGPRRVPMRITEEGRRALRRWLGRPADHVRDLRSELLVKLRLLERAGKDATALLQRQLRLLERSERALDARVPVTQGFDRTLALWRLSSARSSRAFVESLLDRSDGEPVAYTAIGRVHSPHASLDGMPLQPRVDDRGPTRIELTPAHRACLADLEAFSHVWVITHLHESAGWGPTVDPFLDDVPRGTLATRSPHRPNPIGLSLCAILSVDGAGLTVEGSDLLDRTPVLDLKPYVALFDTPAGDVRQGWFEERAARIFERASDTRFTPRSRRR